MSYTSLNDQDVDIGILSETSGDCVAGSPASNDDEVKLGVCDVSMLLEAIAVPR